MSQTYIDAPSHGFGAGDVVVFSNLEGGQGIVQGKAYFVIASGLTADIFQFSETAGGAAFAFDTAITSGDVAAWPTYSLESGIMAPPDAPNAPTGLTATTFLTADADGHQHSVVAADLVHDTTEGVSGAVVEATWTDAGGATPDWSKKSVIHLPVGTLRASFTVPGNLTVWVRAYAVTVYGGTSAYTSVGSVTSAKDSTAPAVPTGLTAVGGILGIAAKWTANAELDLAYYEFQWDDNSGFTSPETKQFKGNLAVITGLAEGTWYFKVRAVDTSGNASAYTSSTSAASRLTGTSDLDPTAVINQATNLINGTATITIDDAGLHIEDGALFLKDEFGETVLVASGFSGAWSDFVALGLYNARFLAGTVGTVPNGRTVALPYWTASDVNAGGTLEFLTADAGIKFTFGATSDAKKIVSDAVPLAGASNFEFGVRYSWAKNTASDLQLRIWYEVSSDPTFAFSSSSYVMSPAELLGAGTSGSGTIAGVDSIRDRYARVVIEVTALGSWHSGDQVTITEAWFKASPAQMGAVSLGSPGGTPDIMPLIVNDTVDPAVSVGNGGVVANMAINGTLSVQKAVKGAQDGTDDAFYVGDDAIIFDADTADTMGIKGQQTATNGKIVFGSGKDTNLYRSAADELKTDDAFVVGGAYISGATVPVVRVYTNTAGTTWNKPTGLHHIVVEVWGAGGGGGAAATTGATTTSGGGGGGGGGYARKLFAASALPSSCTADPGTAGTGGAAGNNAGTAGGASTFSGTGITTVQANGGSGGESGAATSGTSLRNGGDGGTASGGDFNMQGADGGLFFLDAGRKTVGGIGGACAAGGGGGAPSDADGGGAGNDGRPYGGGGGGAQAGNSAGPYAGGDGYQGLVVVTEYYAP